MALAWLGDRWGVAVAIAIANHLPQPQAAPHRTAP